MTDVNSVLDLYIYTSIKVLSGSICPILFIKVLFDLNCYRCHWCHVVTYYDNFHIFYLSKIIIYYNMNKMKNTWKNNQSLDRKEKPRCITSRLSNWLPTWKIIIDDSTCCWSLKKKKKLTNACIWKNNKIENQICWKWNWELKKKTKCSVKNCLVYCILYYFYCSNLIKVSNVKVDLLSKWKNKHLWFRQIKI